MKRGEIELSKLTKQFAEVTAVDGIDLHIPGGEFFSLLGPSGCGKTTTLRMIAGFEQPTSGEILLDGTDVAVGTVVGFPHGSHRTAIKVAEARQALDDGATELDMVIQIGALKSGRDADVQADIEAIVEVGHSADAIVKVIFENAYLTDDEKVRACHLTEAAGGDFVKTSTGFAAGGATHDDLRLMRANVSPHIQVKAAGGVRTLDALIDVMNLGVTRIGATATKTIIDDFRARKLGLAALAAPSAGGADASGSY